jgi:hypothetical protein
MSCTYPWAWTDRDKAAITERDKRALNIGLTGYSSLMNLRLLNLSCYWHKQTRIAGSGLPQNSRKMLPRKKLPGLNGDELIVIVRLQDENSWSKSKVGDTENKQ